MYVMYTLSLSTLNEGQPVVGRLALYVMALKSSCLDLSGVSLLAGEKSKPVLTQLKKQMELEKDHIARELPLGLARCDSPCLLRPFC